MRKRETERQRERERERERERKREREREREKERERERERERGSHTATASRHHREGEESLGSIFVYVYIVSNGTPLTRNNGAGDGFQRTVAGFGVDVFVSSACVSCLNKNTSRLPNLLDIVLGALFKLCFSGICMVGRPSICIYSKTIK